MIGYIIISVFVLVVVIFIYLEYKNQKKYNEERSKKHPKAKKEKKEPIAKPRKVASAKEIETRKEQERKEQERKEQERKEQERKEQEEKFEREKKKRKEEEERKKIDLPECNYPKFDHSRLLEMGLSAEEAHEFVAELVPQLEAQIPLIEEAMAIPDFHNIERLTHSIKGSSTTVGSGGISTLLTDFNTYLKTGNELAIVETYVKYLKHYTQALKEQYS